jgi:hypothetical protein
MAKLSAHNSIKVIGYVFDKSTAEDLAAGQRVEYAYVLRSDGAVLRKIDLITQDNSYPRKDGKPRTYRRGGGYSIYLKRGTVKPATAGQFRTLFKRDPDRVQRY